MSCCSSSSCLICGRRCSQWPPKFIVSSLSFAWSCVAVKSALACFSHQPRKQLVSCRDLFFVYAPGFLAESFPVLSSLAGESDLVFTLDFLARFLLRSSDLPPPRIFAPLLVFDLAACDFGRRASVLVFLAREICFPVGHHAASLRLFSVGHGAVRRVDFPPWLLAPPCLVLFAECAARCWVPLWRAAVLADGLLVLFVRPDLGVGKLARQCLPVNFVFIGSSPYGPSAQAHRGCSCFPDCVWIFRVKVGFVFEPSILRIEFSQSRL
jgi:hypothetical protein